MKKWTVKELIQQVQSQARLGQVWATSKEFAALGDYLYQPEQVMGLITSRYSNQTTLVVLTNQRLFLIQKKALIGFKIEQYGLEAIKSWKTSEYGPYGHIMIEFIDHEPCELIEIKKDQMEPFLVLLATSQQQWQQQIS